MAGSAKDIYETKRCNTCGLCMRACVRACVRACRSSVRVVASALLFRAVSVVRYEYYNDEPPSVTSLAYALPSFLLPPSLTPFLLFARSPTLYCVPALYFGW